MDPLDLYAVLGTHRRATAATIRKAYHRKAKALHPDVNGGDAAKTEEFKRVQAAYDVLSDPIRRERYDTTGRTDASVSNEQEEVAVIDLLAAAYRRIVEPTVRDGREPIFDVMREMVLCTEDSLLTLQGNISRTKAIIKTTKAVAARFKTDKPEQENWLEKIALANVPSLEANIAQMEQEIKYGERALELLKRFKYDRGVNEFNGILRELEKERREKALLEDWDGRPG